MTPLQIPIENGARIITLSAVLEAEPQDDGTLLLIFPAPGFEPDSPHLVVLAGDDADLVWRYLKARAAVGLEVVRDAIARAEHTPAALSSQ